MAYQNLSVAESIGRLTERIHMYDVENQVSSDWLGQPDYESH